MPTFKTRIKANGRIILANDYGPSVRNLESKTIKNIETLHPYLCAIKLNFHLLLPLGKKEISRITRAAHRHGLQAIADIKLNDIGNTNRITAQHLWDMGFDAVIANPIMGLDGLKKLVRSAHRDGRGVITLCHMSAPEARLSYEMRVGGRGLYRLFLEWALESKADGVIVGATFPRIIRYCSDAAGGKLGIYSPGVGAQGGDAGKAVSAGSDYVIVGRSILESRNPLGAIQSLSQGI